MVQQPALLFIESSTSGNGLLALSKARKAGFKVHLLVRSIDHYLRRSPNFVHHLGDCEIVHEIDTTNLDALECYAHEIEHLCGVLSLSDDFLEIAALIAQRLDLPHTSLAGIRHTHDRAMTRFLLQQRDIPQPRFSVVSSGPELERALKVLGLPCIIKPVDHGAPSKTRLVCTLAEARLHFNHLQAQYLYHQEHRDDATSLIPPHILVEEYVGGDEYAVESVTVAGETHFLGVTTKELSGAPSFLEVGYIFPTPLTEAIKRTIYAMVRETLTVLEIDQGHAHTEIKLLNGIPYIMELSIQPAGGHIPELIRLATGLDVIDQKIRLAAGLPLDELTALPHGYAAVSLIVSDKNGELREIPALSEPDILEYKVQDVVLDVQPGMSVRVPQSVHDSLGYFIVTGQFFNEVQRHVSSVRTLLKPDVLEGAYSLTS